MTDATRREEEAYAVWHRVVEAVSVVEGLIGTGMVLAGGVLVALAVAQARFHRDAARRHRREALKPS